MRYNKLIVDDDVCFVLDNRVRLDVCHSASSMKHKCVCPKLERRISTPYVDVFFVFRGGCAFC